MKCPKCGSEHVQYATKTSGGGFSVLDSCCGILAFGPLGLLCGACGSGTTTEEFWICHNCGYRFSTWKAQANAEKEAKLENEYAENKRVLNAAGNKSHKELEDDFAQADTAYQETKQKYAAYLEMLVNGPDSTISRNAKWILWDSSRGVLIAIAVVVALIVSLFIGFCEVYPVLIISVLCGAYLVWYYLIIKKSKNYLIGCNPYFAKLQEKLDIDYKRKQAADDLVKKSKKAQEYEQTHPKR